MLNTNVNYKKEKEKLLSLLNSAVKKCREKASALIQWRDGGIVFDELYTDRVKQEYIKNELEFWKQEELNVRLLYKQAISDLNRRYGVA
ncbi:hypothetical protein ACVWU4_000954 [Campylobacter coli]